MALIYQRERDFVLNQSDRAGGGGLWIADARLWLTEDRKRVVADGHPDARFLFCIPGRAIPMAEAKKYGLVKESHPAETKVIYPKETKRKKK